MEFSKEEQEKILQMSPEEWQEYKKAHNQLENDNKEFIELKLKLEAEKAKYIEKSKELDKEESDYFHEENLKEFERLQNEIIKKEKQEYIKQLNELEAVSNDKKKKPISKVLIVFGVVVVAIIIIAVSCSINSKDDTHFTGEEEYNIRKEYESEEQGYYSEDGKYYLNNETELSKQLDDKLFADSAAKLHFGKNEIGLLCFSRNINTSLFVQRKTIEKLIQLEPKSSKYYLINLNDNTNKDERTINNIVIDYDNLNYLNDDSIFFQYEDFIINRSTTYADVKNYFASKTSDINEYSDSKKHMDINIDNYKIIIDSFEDPSIKPVGTVDKITVNVINR